MKYIIDDQKEQIDFLNANVKVNYERIDDFKEVKDDLLEKIDAFRKTALANRELANAHETKGNLLLTELKGLRSTNFS